jgi:hypothetical protein
MEPEIELRRKRAKAEMLCEQEKKGLGNGT